MWLAAWAAGLSLCAVAAAILLYMGYRGIQYLRPELIFSRPQASLDQAGSGGFLDPLLGTVLLTVIGIAIAAPLAICCALWIVEYGRPRWLTRVVESSIEVVAGTPDILIAVFGLAVFQLHFLAFASSAPNGVATGTSFLTAGAMMSLIALAPMFVATRDGLQAVPAHMREAAFALGKTRIATIRRVLLPSVRPNIATGVTLGVSRIIADTAIVVVMLGDTLRILPDGGLPGLNVLRGSRLHPHQLHLRQLPRRRRARPAKGLRRRRRAAGVRAAAQPRSGTVLPPLPRAHRGDHRRRGDCLKMLDNTISVFIVWKVRNR